MATPLNQAENSSPSPGVYTSVEELVRTRFFARNVNLKTNKRSTAVMDGDTRSRYRGRGMEFSEVRPYQAGDDIRTIDWRVTARTQQPYTKLFQEEKERPIFLMIDQRASMFFGSQTQFKSVSAAKMAATIAWAAQQNNDRIGAMVFNDKQQSDLRARRGKHAVLNLIHTVQEYNQTLKTPVAAKTDLKLARMTEDLRRIARPGSSVFILSDFHDFDQACIESLTLLARHTDINLFHFYDKIETVLPNKVQLHLSDGQERLAIDTSSNLARRLSQRFQQRQNLMRQTARQLELTYAAISTHTTLEETLKDIFVSQRKGLSAQSRTHARM